MKKCVDCKTDKHEGGCNWLDGMAVDDKCPHCGGPVGWFDPAPAGRTMEAMFACRELLFQERKGTVKNATNTSIDVHPGRVQALASAYEASMKLLEDNAERSSAHFRVEVYNGDSDELIGVVDTRRSSALKGRNVMVTEGIWRAEERSSS